MIETAENIQKRAENAGVERASMTQHQEKAAVLNLLDFQQRRRSDSVPHQGGNGKTPKSPRSKKLKATKKTTSSSRLKTPPKYPSKKRKRQTLEDLLKAQRGIKPPPTFVVPKVFLMDMGKKRKRHPTVDDQFEDAMEERPYRPLDGSRHEYLSAQVNGHRSSNNRNPAQKTNYSHQFRRLEQQAETRWRDIARVTAFRLKQQLFATFDPNEEVVLPVDDSQSSSEQAGENKDSSAKVDSGGIYDDAEMSNEFGISTESSNLQASAATQNAGRLQTSTLQSQQASTYDPSGKPNINVPGLAALKASFEESQTPAFADSLGQKQPGGAVNMAVAKPLDLKDLPLAWEEIDKAPQMPPVAPDTEKKKNPIEKIGPHDVLSGRGSLTNGNLGNAWLRELVQRFRFAYFAAPKGVKRAMSKSIVNYVRSKQGRFLEKDKSSSSWYEVGDEKAFDKLSQLLREKVVEEPSSSPSPAKQSQSTSSTSSIEDSLRQTYRYSLTAVNAVSAFAQVRHDPKDVPMAWEEIERPPQLRPVAADIMKLNAIEDIGKFDILHGRGWHDHGGNVWLREITQRFRSVYVAAPIKKSVVKSIVNFVRSKEGRFLGKGEKKSSAWYEVGDDKAFQKVSQLLQSKIQSPPVSDSAMDYTTQPQSPPRPHQLSQVLQEGKQGFGSPAKPSQPIPASSIGQADQPIQNPKSPQSQRLPDLQACKAHIPPQLWEELSKAPKMPPVMADIDERNPIEEIGRSDVSCDEKTWNPGNTWLKELVVKFRIAYSKASTSAKSSLAGSILNYVRSKEVRFLFRNKHPFWYEVGDGKALIKISQLLGDRVPKEDAEETRRRLDENCRAKLPAKFWEKLCEVPKMPPVPADEKKQNPITNVGSFDVLCGQGNIFYANRGNVKLRDMLRKLRHAYNAATAKGSKSTLLRAVLNYVRFKQGRFLEREDPKSESSPWYEAGDKRGLHKCYQAARSVCRENRYWEEE